MNSNVGMAMVKNGQRQSYSSKLLTVPVYISAISWGLKPASQYDAGTMSVTSFTDKNAIFLNKMLFLMPQNLTTWLGGRWKCYAHDRGIEISSIPVSPLHDDCDAMLVPAPYCKLCLTQAGNVRSVLVVENESFCPVHHCHSYTTVYLYYLFYTLLLVQRSHWFANSDVPFQIVTNNLLHDQLFAMQAYMHYIGTRTCKTSS